MASQPNSFGQIPPVGLLGLLSKHPGRNRGGSAVSLARLANSLSQDKIPVYFMTSPLGKDHFISQRLSPEVVHYEITGKHRLMLVWQLWRLLSRKKIQVLLAVDTKASVLACLVKPWLSQEVKIYSCFRNALFSESSVPKTTLSARLLRQMRCIKKRATAVLTNSQGLAEQLAFLLERCPEEIGVVPNGVLDDTFWQRASEPVVHPWLINKEHPVILGVGRLVRQKDWPTLIQAFALLREKISCRLILVGQGDMAERLKSLVWELNIASDVAFPGFVSNALPWMRDASVVALSSLHEGLPNVLIEAMVLGTPAVATDCPFGPAEIIAQLGNGQLVPIGDAVKMSEALLNVLLSPPIPPSPEQLKTYSAVRESRIIQSYLGLKRSLYEVSNDT